MSTFTIPLNQEDMASILSKTLMEKDKIYIMINKLSDGTFYYALYEHGGAICVSSGSKKALDEVAEAVRTSITDYFSGILDANEDPVKHLEKQGIYFGEKKDA